MHPTWAFINGYFLRRGFLDGADGFTIAVNTAHQVFLKYSKLYRLQKGRGKQGIAPVEKTYPTEKKTAAGEG